MYPTPPTKCNPSNTHFHSRYSSNHIPPYPRSLYHAGWNHQNSTNTVREYSATAQPPRENTAVFPTFRFWSGCNRGGYILLPPTTLHRAQKQNLRERNTICAVCRNNTREQHHSTIPDSVPNALQKLQPPQHYFGGVSRKTVSFAGFLGNNYVRIVYTSNPMVGWWWDTRIGTSYCVMVEWCCSRVVFCTLCGWCFFRVYFASGVGVE